MNLEKQKENFKNHRAIFKDLGNKEGVDFMFETISHFVLGVVAIAILHIALTYGMSDKTNDNPKIRFLKTVCFVGAFVGANIMIIFFIYIIVRSPL